MSAERLSQPSTMMCSSILPGSTPSPVATMRSTASAPWIRGNATLPLPQVVASGTIKSKPSLPPSAMTPDRTVSEYQAVRVLMSVLLQPQTPTFRKTSPGPGFGTGQSVFMTSLSSPPCPVVTAARMVGGRGAAFTRRWPCLRAGPRGQLPRRYVATRHHQSREPRPANRQASGSARYRSPCPVRPRVFPSLPVR